MDPTSADYDVCTGRETETWGDGYCDQYTAQLQLHLNSALCDWDGGDCCPSTCNASATNGCTHSIWDCLDPTAAEFGQGSECAGAAQFPSYIADGYCDIDTYNTAACGWDGGDCCLDSCSPRNANAARVHDCGTNGYVCLDPAEVEAGCSVQFMSYIGDGYCDATTATSDYNTAVCNWDGGDCCNSTCTPGTNYTCNPNQAPFDCKDPESPESPCDVPWPSCVRACVSGVGVWACVCVLVMWIRSSVRAKRESVSDNSRRAGTQYVREQIDNGLDHCLLVCGVLSFLLCAD